MKSRGYGGELVDGMRSGLDVGTSEHLRPWYLRYEYRVPDVSGEYYGKRTWLIGWMNKRRRSFTDRSLIDAAVVDETKNR